MNILFIHHALTLGGIETLIVKLCKKLQEEGHLVHLIVEPGGHPSLSEPIKNHANVIEVSHLYTLFTSYHRFNHLTVDYIYCFGPLQMLIGLWLKQQLFKNSRILIGTYHPREYYSTKTPKPYLQKMIENLVNQIPDQNIMFMNNACREQHAKALGRNFAQAAIIPIPINMAEKVTKPLSLPKKIISVGRIVNFKRYNFAMIKVMEELLAKGLSFEYHVYGDGEEYPSLVEAVKASPAQAQIFLHGSLDYAKLAETLEGGFLFVGMGTTVVEAASVGLPALIVIESENDPLTYGFFGEIDSSNLGEKSTQLTKYTLVEKITYLDSLDPNAYQELSAKCLLAAKAFHIDEVVQQYLQFYAQSIEFKLPRMYWVLAKMFGLNVIRQLKKALGFNDPLANRYLDHSSVKNV